MPDTVRAHLCTPKNETYAAQDLIPSGTPVRTKLDIFVVIQPKELILLSTAPLVPRPRKR